MAGYLVIGKPDGREHTVVFRDDSVAGELADAIASEPSMAGWQVLEVKTKLFWGESAAEVKEILRGWKPEAGSKVERRKRKGRIKAVRL